MDRFRDWIIPVPDPLGGDGRWHSGHLWSGRSPSCPRFDLPPPGCHPTRPHTGMDIAGVEGSYIVSPSDGIIEYTGFNTSGGYFVVVKHRVLVGNKSITVWSRHCHCLSKKLVVVGQQVKKGQAIALLGSTGGSASPHDHTSITRTASMPDWRQRHLFIDPEPIYYQGSAEYMQIGHPFPNEVKVLQRRLNALGFTPALVVDGDYGPATATAVKWFQDKKGTEKHGAASGLVLALAFAQPGKEA